LGRPGRRRQSLVANFWLLWVTGRSQKEQKMATQSQHIQALIDQAEQWVSKLDAQDEGKAYRGRKLSDSGAKARFYHAVCDARLGRII